MDQALSYLSEQERSVLDSIHKVIVWGYPLHTHTQSYLHACWVKTFKALGKDTYWFTDEQHESPETFSYKHCLFIAEGFKELMIPLDPTNIYCINFCIYPQKYLRYGARLIEIRFKVNEFHDCNNDWKLDDGTHSLINLSEDVLYERLTSDSGVAPEFRGSTPHPMNYEAVYMTWPTDLLPWEIDLKDAELPKENIIHFVGTPYNNSRLEKFKDIAKKNGIEWIHHDPWTKPVSFEEGKEFVQKSILAPDFRPESSPQDKAMYGELNGKNHLGIGYIPCRLYKNISYGQLPLTDSPHAAEHFGDAVVYEKDLELLFQKGLEAQKDTERKVRAMKLVQSRHTYLHRARDLLRAILQPRPMPLHPKFLPTTWSQVTLVSSLINIQRENVDGRKFSDYMDWFREVLQIRAPMILFVEPQIAELVKSLREGKPTKIICQNFSQTPLGWSTPFIHQTQQSEEWKRYAKHPDDLNNKNAPYVTLMHSKFAWVWNAIQDNPFQTELFFWIDAGLSRFWQGHFVPQVMEPHPRSLRKLYKEKKLYAQVGGFKEQFLQRAIHGKPFTTDELIGCNENILMGGFWGGHKDSMKEACEFALRFYIQELIQKHRVDNDQPTMFFHAQQNIPLYVYIPPFPQIDYANFLLFGTGSVID
jgi:hypothetical protein